MTSHVIEGESAVVREGSDWASGQVALRALVINFNSPELNYLALSLARDSTLAGYVRPYVNKGRFWERGLEHIPLAGRLYKRTFGRRKLEDQRLIDQTFEAGVGSDLLGTAINRLQRLPESMRQRWVHKLQESVRKSVASRASSLKDRANCIVAYQGFGLESFSSLALGDQVKQVLNYPIAHHREHRRMWAEESLREPDFASTWVGFGHWPSGYEQELDDEIERADAILVGSSYARNTFLAAGVAAEKLKTIPYGVDLQIFAPAEVPLQRDRFEVVFAGQLSQRKGISYLLRGYRKFQRPDTRLTLIGEMIGPATPFQPFSNLFRYVPHLTRPELADMYRGADVFAFPTLLEGMGLVVLEAMACGIPVIVTDHGPGDIVRDGIDGFVVPIRDEDAICERLQVLYEDPDLRARMGRNARQRALSLSWGRYTSEVTGYLDLLVNQG
jgi:glycosyltransferase involved in cell wall biosynthesis